MVGLFGSLSENGDAWSFKTCPSDFLSNLSINGWNVIGHLLNKFIWRGIFLENLELKVQFKIRFRGSTLGYLDCWGG